MPAASLQDGEDEENAVEGWFLETVLSGGEKRHIPIRPLPFRIGRSRQMHLRLPLASVSSVHAEIYAADGGLRLRDMGSTNGCFVDRVRVQDAALQPGHVLHFSDSEWRLGCNYEEQECDRPQTLALGSFKLSEHFATGTDKLKELLSERRLETGIQPIVKLRGGTVIGYESLARGRHPELPESPGQLFRLAESIGAEAELSRLCRRVAVEHLSAARGSLKLFLNTHPSELREPGLVESLAELREVAPRLGMVVEIHEAALDDAAAMRRLRGELDRLRIGLAYDDFGAGQARLLELTEVPPDYLKFDPLCIRGIDSAPRARRRLLTSLIEAAHDLRVLCVAMGVETVEESESCAALGFTHAQGDYFGEPAFVAVP